MPPLKLHPAMRKTLTILFLLSMARALAQPTGIGGWSSFLSYANNKCITRLDNAVFIGGVSGLWSLETDTREIHKMNTIQGLSELDISIIGYDAEDKALLIGYASTNIDILYLKGSAHTDISDFELFNVADITRKTVIGVKELRNVIFHNHLAYISTSFGIVVYDMQKREVKDSYLNFAPGANVPDVRGITFLNDDIYASTDYGILKASTNAPNLNDATAWSVIKATTATGDITAFNNKIYVLADSLLQTFDGSIWTNYDGLSKHASVTFDINNNTLCTGRENGFILETGTGNKLTVTESYPEKAVLMGENIWFIKREYGLIRKHILTGQIEFLAPMGPKTNDIFSLEYNQNKVWVTGGRYSARLEPAYNNSLFYAIQNYAPDYYTGTNANALDSIRDCVVSASSPDGSHTYVGTFNYGLIEIVNKTLTNVYGRGAPANFTVRSTASGGPKITGLAFDSKNNLWAVNFLSGDKPLYAKLADGTWTNFSLNNLLGARDVLGRVVIDNYDNKWISTFENNGLVVFKENSLTDPYDVNVRLLSDQKGQGGLASRTVNCVAVDKDGEVWIGTSNGISYFSSTRNIFSADPPDAKTPFIRTGKYSEPLLQYENVTAIEIDGANRKWIGTRQGLWLFNADGTKSLKFFNTDNSPLFSNTIVDLELNPVTGELYIATDKGLMIYKTDAVDAEDDFGDVYAYPNPVRPEYTGPIAIKGLIENCTVKITDIAGNLVFETVSLGGQAVWDGNDFNGNRVKSGVYIVLASSSDGSKKKQTKIAVVN